MHLTDLHGTLSRIERTHGQLLFIRPGDEGWPLGLQGKGQRRELVGLPATGGVEGYRKKGS